MNSQSVNPAPDAPLAHRVKDAKRISGLGHSTIYKLLKAGKLRAVKVGRRRLILHEDLLALLRSNAE